MRLTRASYHILGSSFFRNIKNQNTRDFMGKTYSKDPNVDHQSDSLRLTAFENYQMRLTKQFRYAKFPSSPGNTSVSTDNLCNFAIYKSFSFKSCSKTSKFMFLGTSLGQPTIKWPTWGWHDRIISFLDPASLETKRIKILVILWVKHIQKIPMLTIQVKIWGWRPLRVTKWGWQNNVDIVKFASSLKKKGRATFWEKMVTKRVFFF